LVVCWYVAEYGYGGGAAGAQTRYVVREKEIKTMRTCRIYWAYTIIHEYKWNLSHQEPFFFKSLLLPLFMCWECKLTNVCCGVLWNRTHKAKVSDCCCGDAQTHNCTYKKQNRKRTESDKKLYNYIKCRTSVDSEYAHMYSPTYSVPNIRKKISRCLMIRLMTMCLFCFITGFKKPLLSSHTRLGISV